MTCQHVRRPARRRVLATGALLLVAGTTASGALGTAARAQSAPGGARASVAPETPRAADAFVDSVGVATHFRYTGGAYRNGDALVAALRDLGVRHVRDGFPLDPPPELLAVLRQLPAAGLRAQFVLGSPDLPGTAPLPPASASLAALQAAGVRDVVESLESPNEWDTKSRDGDYVAQLLRFNGELRAAVDASPDYRGVPIVGPSTGRRQHVADLKGFADLVDIANLHNYAAGGTPEEGLQGELARARAVAPGKPLYVTETGYHTALNQTDRQKPVSERAKAVYLPRTLLEDFAAGVDRTYLYQLVDSKPDPGDADQEQHFGLLRSDLSRTPAYEAVRGLLAAVADPAPAGAAAPALSPLRVRVAGEDVRHVLLQRRDGAYQLVLWRRGAVFADGKDQPGSADVTVTLGDEARAVTLQAAGGSVQQLGAGRTVTGRVGDDAVVLTLGETAAGSPEVRFDATATAVGAATAVPPRTTGGDGPPLLLLVGGGVLLVAAGAAGGVLLARRRAAPAGPPA